MILKKWWLWVIIILMVMFLVHFFIKLGNKGYCLEQKPFSYIGEYVDDIPVYGCPPKCYVGSCYGIKTACCPKGIDMFFG